MLPDNSRQFFSQSFYFDVKAPEGVITVEKERDGVNTSYDIVYDLYDDAAEYKNGAYVSTKNIDFSSGNAPEMKLYIDGKLAQTYTLSTFQSSKTIDFLSEFGEKEEFADALTAKAEITFKDKFGHSTTIESEEMAVDFKAPEVTAIEVSAKNLLARGEDTYVINGFEDIGSITARFSDNASDKLDVTYVSSGTYNVTRIGAYEFAIKNLMLSDFSPAYDGITRYNYTFNVTDMGKNSASGFVSFILDLNAPTIYYADLSGIENKTNADSVEIEMYYDHDEYETPEDIVITADGAEIADKSEIGVIKLRVTENGTVTVRTVDAKGKTGEKSFEVDELEDIDLDSQEMSSETQNQHTTHSFLEVREVYDADGKVQFMGIGSGAKLVTTTVDSRVNSSYAASGLAAGTQEFGADVTNEMMSGNDVVLRVYYEGDTAPEFNVRLRMIKDDITKSIKDGVKNG